MRIPGRMRRRRCRGLSFIELLIVLTITGILASIAYPSYANHVLRARRLEGKVALLETMHQQEILYSRSNRYGAFSYDSPGAGQAAFRWWSGPTAAASAYELHAQPCAGAGPAGLAQCVELVATPGTGRVDGRFRDPACGALILSSTGEQRADTGNPACWP